MVLHSLSKILRSSSMSFITSQDVCLRQELLEYMCVHVNDASESLKPSWGENYSAYVRRIVDDSLHVPPNEYSPRLMASSSISESAQDRDVGLGGSCFRNFAKKKSKKKAFQDMLHELRGRDRRRHLHLWKRFGRLFVLCLYLVGTLKRISQEDLMDISILPTSEIFANMLYGLIHEVKKLEHKVKQVKLEEKGIRLVVSEEAREWRDPPNTRRKIA
ncbi:hypothetical protein Tco_0990511 [Tanacetum coccineum]|uniref:Uncharacterized protein n=1 Tax=Tanacetum coccineum TaxID=301880 RepID=A0ABQ5EX16_9ASTR